MKKTILFALSSLLLFAACSKKPTNTPTRDNVLRSHKWVVSSGSLTVKLPNGKDTALNYINLIPACNIDDYLVFDSGSRGAVFSSTLKCSLADADSIPFVWQLTNDGNNLSLYNGFSNIYSVLETILTPYHFDTLSHTPLVLDTVQSTPTVVLDTVWDLKFTPAPSPVIDIYGAKVTNFSNTSFTINYTEVATYPDSTLFHEGAPNFNPVIRLDTFKYSVTYSSY